MRSLKYAILGLLMWQPKTGYEIAKDFNHELAEFWYANHSQIYPQLKKLYNEGLVRYEIEISGEILETKRYYITEEGEKDFLEWLHKKEKIQKTPKDIFRLRMYFSNNLSLDERLKMLEGQKKQHVGRLETLKQMINQYEEVPAYDSNHFGDFVVIRGAIRRQEGIIDWIDECIGYCKCAMDSIME